MMSPSGQQHASEIIEDLACPRCEYNLRGLGAAVIHCPECGVECNIPQMIARRWTRPWHQAPGFSKLLRPLVWLAIAVLFLFAVGVLELAEAEGTGLVTAAFGLVVVSVWALLMRQTRGQLMDGRGLAMAALAHVLFVGYIAGLVGVAWSVIGAIAWPNIPNLIAAAVVVPTMAALLVACRRGERYIAEQCLKTFLLERNPPAAR